MYAEVPPELKSKWKVIVDLMAQAMEVPIACVMKAHKDELEVVVSNQNAPTSYKEGQRHLIHESFDNEVIEKKKRLKITGSINEIKSNQLFRGNMVSYLGLPILTTKGQAFGTICVMDVGHNKFPKNGESILKHYKDIVEMDLLAFSSVLRSDDLSEKAFMTSSSNFRIEDNEEYKKLFESAHLAIFILNKGFVFVECNSMVLKMLGRRKDEIIGLTPMDISPKLQPGGTPSSDLVKLDTSAALNGQDQRFDWVLIKGDGTEISTEVSLSSFSKEGNTYVFAMVKDLTELKVRDKELIESEERFRTLYTQSADGIIIYDPENGIIDCNNAVLDLLNYKTSEQLVGKFPWDLSPEYQPNGLHSKDVAREMDEKCLNEGKNRYEWILIKKDSKTIWVDLVLTRIKFMGRMFIHIIMRDIDESKKNQLALMRHQNHLEELVKERTLELQQNKDELLAQYAEMEAILKELNETQDKLILSEKMASLGVLSAGIAHEINNPLNFIKGGIDGLSPYLIERNNENDQLLVKYMEIIKEGVNRASSILNSLSHFSRSNTQMDEVCDINEILENCLIILSNKIKDRIEVERFGKSYSVKGNSGRLHQAFMNIISNAEQAIVDSGKITIKTKLINQKLNIQISDTGVGIDKKHINKIMDPFFTTKPPGEGTGLGLSITFKIIEEHTGTILVRSDLGKGATFEIQLPVCN